MGSQHRMNQKNISQLKIIYFHIWQFFESTFLEYIFGFKSGLSEIEY